MKSNKRIFKLIVSLITVISLFFSFIIFANANEENIALKKSVTVSRETSGKAHDKVTDGVKNIVTSSNAWNVKAGDYIILDLGANTVFNQLIIYEYSFQRGIGYKLEVSEDNNTYKTIKEDSDFIAPLDLNFKTNAPHFAGVISFPNQTARYIKLTVNETNEGKLCYIEEIEVYNSQTPEQFPGEASLSKPSTVEDTSSTDENGFKTTKPSNVINENYAAGKPVKVSRETSGKYHERITDGVKNVSMGAHSWNLKAGDFAIIDLGASKSIDCVIVYEYSHLRAKDYILELSEDMTVWNTVAKVTDYICLDGESGEKSNAPHYFGKIEFTKTNARYVKLTVNETQDDKIAYIEEIEVYDKSNMPVIEAVKTEEEITLNPPVQIADIPYSKENFHIYLFIGQSNMNGRDSVPNSERIVLEDVYLLNKDGMWEYAQPYPYGTKYSDYQGYNRYSTVDEDTKNGLNSASSFARGITSNISDDIGIGIISNARGGTSIDAWQKGSGENLYEEAVRRTREAIVNGGTLKGILWLQGESCAKKDGYLDKLNDMVTNMRADLGVGEEVPFIASEIIQTRPEGNVNIRKIAEKIKNSDYVSSSGTNTIDGLHYDAESQKLIGLRYAEKILSKIYNVQMTAEELHNRIYSNAEEEIIPDYKYKIKINGKYLITDVEPNMYADRLFVPLRAIFEALDSIVEWDEQTQKVTGKKGDKTVVMYIGSTNALVNGQEIKIDVAPMLVNNRTLVPIRFISESLGAKVDWNQETQTAFIELN